MNPYAQKFPWPSYLKWAVVALICKVGITILANYPDYFPPDFDADFLIGRQKMFRGAYKIAFYVHILATPIVLFQGLLLLSERFRNRNLKLHRWMGRVQVTVVLALVVPSSLIMSQYTLARRISGFGFAASSLITGACTAMGWRCAVMRQFRRHKRWMQRSYLLLCSAVTLRLIGGVSSYLTVDPFDSYRFASWASWIVPLLCFELVNIASQRWFAGQSKTSQESAPSNR